MHRTRRLCVKVVSVVNFLVFFSFVSICCSLSHVEPRFVVLPLNRWCKPTFASCQTIIHAWIYYIMCYKTFIYSCRVYQMADSHIRSLFCLFILRLFHRSSSSFRWKTDEIVCCLCGGFSDANGLFWRWIWFGACIFSSMIRDRLCGRFCIWNGSKPLSATYRITTKMIERANTVLLCGLIVPIADKTLCCNISVAPVK